MELKSAAVGYLRLMLLAALTFLLLRLLGMTGIEQFVQNYAVKMLSHVPLHEGMI